MIRHLIEKIIKVRNLLGKVLTVYYLKYTVNTEKKLEGYNVFGYFSKILGQGEVVRSFADNLLEKGENFVLIDVVNYNHKRIPSCDESKYKKFYSKKLIYNKNIFFIDLPLLKKIHKVIPSIFRDKYNITVFWWEFETGFDDRIDILDKFNEIYVFSDFIKQTLETIKNRRFIITKIKYPFKKNWVIEESEDKIRENYYLKGKFCFFFNMDYRSSYNRKNPEAIVKALHKEFSDNENVILVVKTNNEDGFSDKVNKFKKFITDRKLDNRVLIIKETLTRNGFMSLLNSMDCYISLHRGEGLGLGILEALALDKPVIATNYGGNAEYMNHKLAYPVKYLMVTANDDFEAYRGVKLWAEPDNEDAQRRMREVFVKFNRYLR